MCIHRGFVRDETAEMRPWPGGDAAKQNADGTAARWRSTSIRIGRDNTGRRSSDNNELLAPDTVGNLSHLRARTASAARLIMIASRREDLLATNIRERRERKEIFVHKLDADRINLNAFPV